MQGFCLNSTVNTVSTGPELCFVNRKAIWNRLLFQDEIHFRCHSATVRPTGDRQNDG